LTATAEWTSQRGVRKGEHEAKVPQGEGTWRVYIADGRAHANHVLLIVIHDEEGRGTIVRLHQVISQVERLHWQAHLHTWKDDADSKEDGRAPNN
jgi:hypothetical protein